MTERSVDYKFYIHADREETLGCVRTEIAEATWRAGHCAHAFHRRQGTSEGSQIRDGIQQSDVFVVLTETASETVRQECASALANGKPVLALVVGSDVRSEDLEELESIVSRSPETSLVQHVSTTVPEVIVNEYLIALHKIIRKLDRTRVLMEAGWDPHTPNRFVRKFAVGRVLSMRCEQNPFLKKGIADFFYENNFPHLIQHGVRHLFLESGSSIAYVAETLTEGMHAEWTLSKPHLEIEANNILAYLVLASATKVRVSLYPPGRPDDKYGATLGTLMWVEPERGRPIDEEARREMSKIKDYLKGSYKKNGIFLGATSGIDLGPDTPGFHTGSFPMMLFKRALLEAAMESDIPLVIICDEDKMPYAFNPSKCYSICDSDLPWDIVCKDAPIAIACAFRSQERAQLTMPRLMEMGFSEGQQESNGQIPWCVIAANEKFASVSKGWFRSRPLTMNSERQLQNRPLRTAI